MSEVNGVPANLAALKAVEQAKAKAKSPLVYDKTDARFLLVMLLMGYLLVKLVLATFGGVGVTVFTAAMCLCFVLFYACNRQRLSLVSWGFLGLILVTGGCFSYYRDGLLGSLGLLLLLVLFVYFIAVTSKVRLQGRLDGLFLFDLLDTAFVLPCRNFAAGGEIAKKQLGEAKQGRNILMTLLGILLALPLVFYVASLLQRADPAFSNLWRQILNSFLSKAIINGFQLLVAIPVALYLFSLLFGAKKQAGKPCRTVESTQELARKLRFLPTPLVLGGVTPLLVIYVLFFVSQSAYFLSAFSGLLPEGFHYAEFARRGFFELCAVCAINFLVIFLLMFLTRRREGKHPLYGCYNLILSLFSLALIVMSLRKMILYIQAYGLTPLRLYTSWFMGLLFVCFLLVMVKTVWSKFNGGKWSLAVATVMFLALCFSNPNGQIARYNVEHYLSGELQTLDVPLLQELGDSSTPYLIRLLQTDDVLWGYQEQARQALQGRMVSFRFYNRDWRTMTLVQWRSNRLLDEHWELILEGANLEDIDSGRFDRWISQEF